jgi:hypothetical protein
MKLAACGVLLLASLAAGTALGAKPCEELKAEIAKKLEAKSVKGYSLDIVEKGKAAEDKKIVGSCEGGLKEIVYQRGEPSKEKPAAEEKK